MSQHQGQSKQWWQLPFDLYDVFGYLFPGLVFLIALGVLVTTPPRVDQVPPLIQSLGEGLRDPLQWWEGTLIILIVIVLLYAAGHFIASISVIVLDRILLGGVFGHPYRRLLDLPSEPDRITRACYEYLFLLVNGWMLYIVFFGDHATPVTPLLGVAVLILILSLPKAHRILSHPDQAHITNRGPLLSLYCWLPEKVLDKALDLFKRLARLDKKFAEPMRKAVASDFQSRFKGLKIESVETDAFWLTYDSVSQRSQVHARAIMNFVHMFSFARNLSASAFLPVLTACISESLGWDFYSGFNRPIAFGLLLVGWVMMWRYYYLFSRYYTEYTFRAFVALNAEEAASSAAVRQGDF